MLRPDVASAFTDLLDTIVVLTMRALVSASEMLIDAEAPIPRPLDCCCRLTAPAPVWTVEVSDAFTATSPVEVTLLPESSASVIESANVLNVTAPAMFALTADPPWGLAWADPLAAPEMIDWVLRASINRLRVVVRLVTFWTTASMRFDLNALCA